MADRDDPSQYPQDDGNDNDVTFAGDTTIEDHQLQDDAEGEYASAEQMLDYVDPGIILDYMQQNPGRFLVRKRGEELRVYSRQIIVSTMTDSGPGTLQGLSFRETSTTTPALVSLHDGIDASAPVILEITLGPNESTREWFAGNGLSYRYGLYVSIDSGSVRGNLFQQVVTSV